MKAWASKLITLFIRFSLVLTIQPSIWMPTCPTSSENTLIPHPVDCRKFFVCIEGIVYPVSCPYGLTWNSILNKCSSLSACEQRVKVPKYNRLCPLDENPENPTHLPDLNDCGKFYECESGFAFHLACPVGQHWSSQHDSCVESSEANCKIIKTLTGNGVLNAECPLEDDLDNPTHLPHPEDCTKFYKCLSGRGYILSCPYGLHWNDAANRCDSPFIAQCRKQSVSLLHTSTTTNPATPSLPDHTEAKSISPQPTSTTSAVQSDVPVCPENGVKNFGIPGQCDKYFSCSQGKLYVMTCREGREWSEIVGGCVQASLAGCTGNFLTTSTKNPPLNPFLPPSNTTMRLTCSPGIEFLSHPIDCHKFIVCDNGKPIEKSCPDGLYFNRKASRCQWTDESC